MPERPATRVLTELRRTTLAVACMLPLGGLPAGVLAQNVPAGLRACAAESDPGQRLDCYDREMKRLLAAPRQPGKPPPPPPAAKPAPAVPAQAGAASPPVAQPTSAQPAPSSSGQTAPRSKGTWKKLFGGGTSSRVTARVASLERSPDAMVIRLDNGEVWRQIGRASGDLTLRPGDQVTIEKHLGSYWLSARYVSDMRVRQEPP
jgi:hypothetical protein